MCSSVAAQTTTKVIKVGGELTHTIRAGDTLTKVSARFGVPLSQLMQMNKLTIDSILQPGTHLRVRNEHLVVVQTDDPILINVPQRMLYLLRDGKVEGAFPIAVGKRSWETPVGHFRVTRLIRDPSWNVPDSIQAEMSAHGQQPLPLVPPGTENPLGAHWIGLTAHGVGIHGTNAPESIYSFSTHSCIRLHPDDVKTVFERVTVGSHVLVTYQPIIVSGINGRLWMEINPDPYHRLKYPVKEVVEEELRRLEEVKVDAGKVRTEIYRPSGVAQDVSLSTMK